VPNAVYPFRASRFQYVLVIDSVLSADSVNYFCVVKTINIVRLQDNKLIQVITPDENDPLCGLPPDQKKAVSRVKRRPIRYLGNVSYFKMITC
jgi:hypothetical protein